MRAIVQIVKNASVSVEGNVISSIKKGMLVFVAVENSDTLEDIDWLTKKIVNLRVFYDNNASLNLNVKDIDGEILVVSQFTLFASTKKGNRPSYLRSSKPEFAIPMYEKFLLSMKTLFGKEIKTGQFGAMMEVSLVNDGPTTIILDTKYKE
jgi:D-tyrosyl-tRNA(Tyr) deacylase